MEKLNELALTQLQQGPESGEVMVLGLPAAVVPTGEIEMNVRMIIGNVKTGMKKIDSLATEMPLVEMIGLEEDIHSLDRAHRLDGGTINMMARGKILTIPDEITSDDVREVETVPLSQTIERNGED